MHIWQRARGAEPLARSESDPERKATVPEHYRRRLTSMQAHLALTQLPDLDRNTQARLALARIYQRPVTQCWLHFFATGTTETVPTTT